MNIVQGSLVLILGSDNKVLFNGVEVPNLGVQVTFDGKVTLRVAEDPILAELQAAGVKIVRV